MDYPLGFKKALRFLTNSIYDILVPQTVSLWSHPLPHLTPLHSAIRGNGINVGGECSMAFIPGERLDGVHTVDSDSLIRSPNHDSLSAWIDANEYGILIVPEFTANKK